MARRCSVPSELIRHCLNQPCVEANECLHNKKIDAQANRDSLSKPMMLQGRTVIAERLSDGTLIEKPMLSGIEKPEELPRIFNRGHWGELRTLAKYTCIDWATF